jgi:Na+/H+ antiporter NhaA
MMHMRDAGKIAVLMGSVCSGLLGTVLIGLAHRKEHE